MFYLFYFKLFIFIYSLFISFERFLTLFFQMFSQTFFSYLSSFLFVVPLPFSLSFYLPDSNPLLSFDSQVREVHLYTGIYKILIRIYNTWCCNRFTSKDKDCWNDASLEHLKISLRWFLSSVFLSQIITGEGCICRWLWMGECQELMYKHLTVSIWLINQHVWAH